jgi:hypothetical protein
MVLQIHHVACRCIYKALIARLGTWTGKKKIGSVGKRGVDLFDILLLFFFFFFPLKSYG